MTTSRLKLYNGALMLAQQRSIASLAVNEEPRRLLDEVWNDGGVRFCLEQGQWKFAMRSSELSYETAITPQFGYSRAFAKPSDWVTTSAVCQDGYFRSPLLQYTDEIGYWFADLDTLYVRYVSDGADYGSDLSKWPASFTEYVKAYFAGRIVGKIAQDNKLISAILGAKQDGEGGLVKASLTTAKNRDAMAGPTTFPARGSWVRASLGQGGRRGPFGDGGTSGNLIG